jgi:hypothetical protein
MHEIHKRIKLFYVAIAWTGTTDVLWKKKTSARISRAIDKFIDEHITDMRKHLN